jgi:phytol kinase
MPPQQLSSLFSDNPLAQNLLAAIATVVYIKVVINSCHIAVSRGILAPRISRKCVHMAAGAWIVWWPFFHKDHWTWRLNVAVPVIYTIQLFVKGLILQNPKDTDVQTLTRTGDPKELLNGPILFTIVMTAVGLCLFRQQMGVVIMSCLGFGDGVAPLMGYYLPFGSYPTWPFGPNDHKTLSGSIVFVMASVIGYFLMEFVIDDDVVGTSLTRSKGGDDLAMILQVATVAAITEGICGPFDNPIIALSALLTYQYLANNL